MCAVVSVPMSAEQELVDAFSNELLYLTRPTRYDIESVTNNFVKGQAQAAPMLAAALEEHLMKCEPHLKVPALFLLDHIAKTVPIPYQALFSTRLHQVFTTARQQARESDQPSFAKVLQAWTTQGIFSGQLLHALHPTAPTVTASQMPPAGLSSAQPAAMQTVAPPVQQPVVMNGMHSTASIPGNAQHVPVPLQQMQAVHPVPTQVPTLQPQPGPQPGPQPVPHPAVQLPQTLQPVHQAVLQPFGHPIAQPIGQPAMGVQLLSSLPQAAPGGAAQYVTCQPMAGIAGPLSGVGQGLVPSMTVVSASVVQRPVVAPIQLQGGGRQLLPYQQAYAVRQPPVLLPAQPAQQPAAAAAPLPAQPAASEPPQASVSVLLDSLASSMAKSTNRDDPGLLTETQFDPKRLKGFNQLALEQLKKDSAKTRPALIDLQIQRRRNRESGVKSKTWFVSAKRWVAGATLSDPDPALLGVQQVYHPPVLHTHPCHIPPPFHGGNPPACIGSLLVLQVVSRVASVCTLANACCLLLLAALCASPPAGLACSPAGGCLLLGLARDGVVSVAIAPSTPRPLANSVAAPLILTWRPRAETEAAALCAVPLVQ